MSGKEKTGITQRVWAFMLENGGRWTVAELAEQMKENATYMDRIVWSMHDVGTVCKYRSGQRKNGVAFGVGPRNRIPQGIRLQDVTAALGIRTQIDQPTRAANESNRRNAA